MVVRARCKLEKPQLENHRDMIRFLMPLGLLFLTGCALFERPDHFEATPIPYSNLAGWENENHAEALAAFNQSCPILFSKPRPKTEKSNIQISGEIWQRLCQQAVNNPNPKDFFEENFQPYRIANWGDEKGLFTGYYEPLLYGSFKKQGDFKYPVYRLPPDFQKPYYTRAEIDNGALAGRGLEIVWVDDPVMLFFMHIQGSGRIRLADGHEFIVGYAEQNGHAYATLGKIMADEGLMPKDGINFFTLRQWLYDHPDQAFEMMQRNPSYVFFKKQDNTEIVGSIGAPLTPRRSLAVDFRHIPYGLPLYLEATLPAMPGAPEQPFQRILIAQDTGGAIRKPVRGDVFFGHGQEAEYLAGYMKQRGRYALLVPKEIVITTEQ